MLFLIISQLAIRPLLKMSTNQPFKVFQSQIVISSWASKTISSAKIPIRSFKNMALSFRN